MATTETTGTMKYKDASGNVIAMMPKTKVSQVDGLEAALADAKTYTDSAIQSAIQNTWEASY